MDEGAQILTCAPGAAGYPCEGSKLGDTTNMHYSRDPNSGHPNNGPYVRRLDTYQT